MKAKNLKKRIRRLEARLQKGAKKLARLKQKLEAPSQKKLPAKPAVAVTKPGATPKVKRKLNLTPERRAQLAETMRARWAAKRAAAATAQSGPSGPEPSPQQ
jgi:hypothetical protein